MKKEIEDRLLASERILQIWQPEDVFDELKSKHLKVSVKKEKIDSVYDVDTVTVELRFNSPMSMEVQIITVIEAMKEFESDPAIRKVIHNSHVLTESVDESEDKRHGEVVFTIISNLDK